MPPRAGGRRAPRPPPPATSARLLSPRLCSLRLAPPGGVARCGQSYEVSRMYGVWGRRILWSVVCMVCGQSYVWCVGRRILTVKRRPPPPATSARPPSPRLCSLRLAPPDGVARCGQS